MIDQIFELSWSWYEEYCPYLFYHEKKTLRQFERDVKYLLRKYGNQYIKQEKSWISAHGWIEFVCIKLTELGYVPIRPNRFNIFGASIIDNKKDDDDKAFGKLIGSELLAKAIKCNKSFRLKLDKRCKQRIKARSNSTPLKH